MRVTHVRLVFGRPSADLCLIYIGLYLKIINPYATRTYKHPERTENPCVADSGASDWLAYYSLWETALRIAVTVYGDKQRALNTSHNSQVFHKSL